MISAFRILLLCMIIAIGYCGPKTKWYGPVLDHKHEWRNRLYMMLNLSIPKESFTAEHRGSPHWDNVDGSKNLSRPGYPLVRNGPGGVEIGTKTAVPPVNTEEGSYLWYYPSHSYVDRTYWSWGCMEYEPSSSAPKFYGICRERDGQQPLVWRHPGVYDDWLKLTKQSIFIWILDGVLTGTSNLVCRACRTGCAIDWCAYARLPLVAAKEFFEFLGVKVGRWVDFVALVGFVVVGYCMFAKRLWYKLRSRTLKVMPLGLVFHPEVAGNSPALPINGNPVGVIILSDGTKGLFEGSWGLASIVRIGKLKKIYLVTARHVVSVLKDKKVLAASWTGETWKSIPWTMPDVVVDSPHDDVVVFEVNQALPAELGVKVGKLVRYAGFGRVYQVFSAGPSGWLSSNTVLSLVNGSFVHNASTSAGSSGGPISANGCIVGLHLGGFSDPAQQTSGRNIATDVAWLMSLMDPPKVALEGYEEDQGLHWTTAEDFDRIARNHINNYGDRVMKRHFFFNGGDGPVWCTRVTIGNAYRIKETELSKEEGDIFLKAFRNARNSVDYERAIQDAHHALEEHDRLESLQEDRKFAEDYNATQEDPDEGVQDWWDDMMAQQSEDEEIDQQDRTVYDAIEGQDVRNRTGAFKREVNRVEDPLLQKVQKEMKQVRREIRLWKATTKLVGEIDPDPKSTRKKQLKEREALRVIQNETQIAIKEAEIRLKELEQKRQEILGVKASEAAKQFVDDHKYEGPVVIQEASTSLTSPTMPKGQDKGKEQLMKVAALAAALHGDPEMSAQKLGKKQGVHIVAVDPKAAAQVMAQVAATGGSVGKRAVNAFIQDNRVHTQRAKLQAQLAKKQAIKLVAKNLVPEANEGEEDRKVAPQAKAPWRQQPMRRLVKGPDCKHDDVAVCSKCLKNPHFRPGGSAEPPPEATQSSSLPNKSCSGSASTTFKTEVNSPAGSNAAVVPSPDPATLKKLQSLMTELSRLLPKQPSEG